MCGVWWALVVVVARESVDVVYDALLDVLPLGVLGGRGLGGPTPARAEPARAPSARLDKGEISPHFAPQKEVSEEEGVQLPLAWKNRVELRGHHADLVRLLRSMKAGEHGLVAQAVGEKWEHDVGRCPGSLRKHGPCGHASFAPYSCKFPLCPWCQHRRSDKARRNLSRVVDLLSEPMLLTFNPPNIGNLSAVAVGSLMAAFTRLRRRDVLACVKGGVRSIETTWRGEKGWNLHLHALVDSPWIAHYPQIDIKWIGGQWEVVKEHPGLAREFTIVCQKFPELRSPRLDFDRDNPGHWYFVDLRRADSGAVAEVVKYIAKGSEIVRGGAGALVDFLLATKNRRMIQPFGSLYDVDLEGEEEESEDFDVSAQNDCPYEDCPSPGLADWEFIMYGFGDWVLDRDSRTGGYRVVGLARDGPGGDV